MKAASFVAFMFLIPILIPNRGFASPSTVPAFLWSPYHHLFSAPGQKEAVKYQIISPKDLAKSVSSEAGWSNFLCNGKKLQESPDLMLVFVGSELQSSDISADKHADQALVDFLKVSFTRSNFSMAFPYVSTSEKKTMENLLVPGFAESCEHDLGIQNVAFIGSCSRDGGNHEKNFAWNSVQDYLASGMGEKFEEKTDLVVFCGGVSEHLDQSRPESEILSEMINSVDQSGAKYSVLYVSDPYRSIHYPSYRELERFLAEGVSGNGLANSTICDEVCQIKSSLLEGVLVGIVLLIILISGLCCMMGIDTPTRFETPQES